MQVDFTQRETCPLCQSGQSKTLCDHGYDEPKLKSFIADFYQGRIGDATLLQGRYRVVKCDQCGFVYQDPILGDKGMQLLYHDWVDQERSLQKKKNAPAKLYHQYAGQVKTLSQLFDKPPAQTRVLDFGMGWGYWCRMAQAHGYDVSGFELSLQRCKHAREMGLRVIDKLPQSEDQFDFIFANQVFEHLADPVRILSELCLCLESDGVVYLRVPDGRGVDRRLQSQGWSTELDAIHPLEHINCFTRKTLIDLAASAGLHPFNPPLRLNWGSLRGGIRREIADRWFATHLMFRR
jgi:2-polyprenyl-3-methyl-5-hydroxy-6-metoxy-1,4-benzoquinol methylase